MKKLFLFFLCLIPFSVSAESILSLEVLNGSLSRKFESNNNVYSVTLNEGEEKLELKYNLKDKEASVENTETVMAGSDVTTLKVTNSDGSTETYMFYVNKEMATPVFKEYKSSKQKEEKIPYLEYYVGIPCTIFILFLFKVFVLGFKRHK